MTGLRIAARVESSSARPSWRTPHSCTTPIGFAIREREDVADVPSHQVALLEARQLEHAAPGREHPRVAVADDEARRGSRIVVLEQLEDEAESAAPALQRVRAGEPLEAVDVDRAVLAVRADVDGHGRIVGTRRRATADKAHSVDDRAAHSLASEPGADRAGGDHGLRALARAHAWSRPAGLREPVGVVGDRPGGLLGVDLGALRRDRVGAVRAGARLAGDAGCGVVPRRAAQLRRARAAAPAPTEMSRFAMPRSCGRSAR